MPNFDAVHIFSEWDDGPLSGVADFYSRPHLYYAEFSRYSFEDTDARETYLVIPIDAAEFHALRDKLACVNDSRCIYSSVPDLSTVTVFPYRLPTHNAGGEFGRVWNTFVKKMLSVASSATRVHADFKPRGADGEEPDEMYAEDAPLEVAWTEAVPPRAGRDEITALIHDYGMDRGNEPATGLGEEDVIQGEDVPF
jgi:hypothetical protein